MSHLRDYIYKGRIVGKVNTPAVQPNGIYIQAKPKTHINPDDLGLMILCLLDGYDYKIGNSGELWLKLPRNTKYGPILNGIACAYYELQTRKKEHAEERQTLTKEAE